MNSVDEIANLGRIEFPLLARASLLRACAFVRGIRAGRGFALCSRRICIANLGEGGRGVCGRGDVLKFIEIVIFLQPSLNFYLDVQRTGL